MEPVTDAGVAAVGDDDAPNRKYPVPQLSKFELDAMERARERHRSFIEEGTVQVAGGRTFQGRPFISKPEVLLFKDFEVNQTYTKRFTLTNVSYTFNSFNLLTMPDDVRDFFEISYTRPGRMSAGTSCAIEISFSPKVNEDIETELSFLSQTGPFTVPLRCLRMRSVPSVSHTDVDFGNVVVGETASFALTIKNEGAIPSMFVFENPITGLPVDAPEAPKVPLPPATGDSENGTGDLDGEDGEVERIECDTEEQLRLRVQDTMREEVTRREAVHSHVVQLAGAGEVGSYTTVQHVVTCSPLHLGHFERDTTLRFEQTGELITVRFRGNAVDLPIYCQEPMLDYKCCVFGKQYRKKLVVCNRGKVSHKVTFRVPRPLQGALEFSPDMGFAQAGGHLDIVVKFAPTQDLLQRCARFTCPCLDMLIIPIEIFDKEQSLPVFFVLQCLLTTSRLTAEPSFVDFGDCYVSQQIVQHVRVTNHSILPQQYSFHRIQKGLQVCVPSHGTELAVTGDNGVCEGMLLPKETVEVDLTFRPILPVSHNFALEMRTSLGEKLQLGWRGQGIKQPLDLSHTVVSLPAVAPGDIVSQNLILGNPSSAAQLFEFIVPHTDQSHIRMAPTTGTLEPGASIVVQLEFCPPKKLDSDDRARVKTLMGRDDAAQSEEEGDGAAAAAAAAAAVGEEKSGDVDGAAAAEGDADANAATEAGMGVESDGEEERKSGSAGIAGEDDGVGPLVLEQPNSLNNRAVERLAVVRDGAVTEIQEVSGRLVSSAAVAGLPEWGMSSTGTIEGPEAWSIHGTWRIPCIVQRRGVEVNASAATTSGGGAAGNESTRNVADDGSNAEFSQADDGSQTVSANQETGEGAGNSRNCASDGRGPVPMLVEVHTTVITRQLEVDQDKVDFGQLSVGQRQLITLRIRNRSNTTADLRADPLNAVGPFTVLNAFRPIPPRDLHRVVLEYAPTAKGITVEKLMVYSDALCKHVEIALRGEGVTPRVSIAPANGNVHFGHVVAGTEVTRELRVTNESKFPVTFTMTACSEQPRNFGPWPAFTFSPTTATIAGGECRSVDCVFAPDRGRLWPYRLEAAVVVPNQEKEQRVNLFGRAWERELYLVPSKVAHEAYERANEEMEDLMAVPRPAADMLTRLREENAVAPMNPPSITVTFPLDAPDASTGDEKAAEDDVRKESVVVGSVDLIPDGATSSAGSYEFVLGQEAAQSGMFTISPDKGSIVKGAETTIELTFTPPERPATGGLEVGQWKSFAATCTLSGGYAPEGAPESIEVPVTLEAFLWL